VHCSRRRAVLYFIFVHGISPSALLLVGNATLVVSHCVYESQICPSPLPASIPLALSGAAAPEQGEQEPEAGARGGVVLV
jgi:hypothetical protein